MKSDGRVRAAAAMLVALAVVGAMLASGTAGAQAATTTLCDSQTAQVAGGAYAVTNDEWGSGAPECITTDGNADFTVANSSIDQTDDVPGGYPSIYQGCNWGACTTGGLSDDPVQVSALTAGEVTTSWDTTQPGSGEYDVAYDIWFNHTATTNVEPDCTEMMVWLNHAGAVQPLGQVVASGVTIDGNGYDVWSGQNQDAAYNTVTYAMTTPSTSVTGLDVGSLAQDAVSRGLLSSSCYLIEVEAGFELWQGGAGLATNSFSVTENGGGTGTATGETSPSPSPSPSPAPSTAAPAPATSTAPPPISELVAPSPSPSPSPAAPAPSPAGQGAPPPGLSSPPGTSPAQVSGTGQITTVGGMCLDDRGAQTNDFNPVQVNNCNGTAAQQWTMVLAGSTVHVFGKCLDVNGGGTADGTPVDLYDCIDMGSQVFIPQANGELYNPQSGKCLDDPDGSTTPGTQLQIWDCNGGANQQWALS
jgi:cellulose 1,4-beta-cellobiosidase